MRDKLIAMTIYVSVGWLVGWLLLVFITPSTRAPQYYVSVGRGNKVLELLIR
jgi:hypothetical protein